MDEGGLVERELDINAAVPGLRTETSGAVRLSAAEVQGRRTSSQGGEPSMGFMFLRYPAIRRSLQMKRQSY